MGINDTFLKSDGTRNAVNGGYQQIAVQLWMTDTGIQPLLGIRTVSDFLCRWCLTQNLMGGLVQQISTTETYQEHLQERVTDEHTHDNSCNGQQVLLDGQGLCPACKHADHHIRQHGKDIAEILEHITKACQSYAVKDVPPAIIVYCLWLILIVLLIALLSDIWLIIDNRLLWGRSRCRLDLFLRFDRFLCFLFQPCKVSSVSILHAWGYNHRNVIVPVFCGWDVAL